MALKHQPCAYCGSSKSPRTKGHVIPKNLYPTETNAITVPECSDCKAIWEDAEPHFRNIMMAIWNPEKMVKDNRFTRMQRSFKKCDGTRRLREFIDRIVPAPPPNQGREMLYPAKDPAFNLILRRIVRGLCHVNKLGSPVADNRVSCDVMKYDVPEAFKPDFTWSEIAPGFFRYGYVFLDRDNLHSFWLFRFSKHIKFFGYVSGNEAGCPDHTNTT